jgi:hypothetical protein
MQAAFQPFPGLGFLRSGDGEQVATVLPYWEEVDRRGGQVVGWGSIALVVVCIVWIHHINF